MIIFPIIYLVSLLLAPQVWLEPLVGFPIDYLLYPVWFIALSVTGQWANIKFGTAEKFFLLWILWVTLSIITNGLLSAEYWIIVLFYIKWFILYMLISASLTSCEQLKKIIFIWVFLIIMLSVEGIQQYYDGIGWAGQPLSWIDPDAMLAGKPGRTMWVGIFEGVGVFCVLYVTAFPFLLIGLEKGTNILVKIISILSLPLLAVAIYFNASRGGMIATIVVFFSYCTRYIKTKNYFIVAVGIVIVLAAIAIAPSYLTTMDDQSHSASHRIESWVQGIEMITQNPLFGIGKSYFPKYTGKLDAHNTYIENFGETGFVGFYAWVGLIYFNLRRLYIFLTESVNSTEKKLAKGLLLAIIGYLTSSFFVTLEYETLYVLLALCTVVGRHNSYDPKLSKFDIKIIFSFIILLFVSVKTCAILWN